MRIFVARFVLMCGVLALAGTAGAACAVGHPGHHGGAPHTAVAADAVTGHDHAHEHPDHGCVSDVLSLPSITKASAHDLPAIADTPVATFGIAAGTEPTPLPRGAPGDRALPILLCVLRH